jgi:hypothetical protein
LAGETEVLGGNLPRRHFVHHKIPHDDPVSNPGPQRWEASAPNRLSYGAATGAILIGSPLDWGRAGILVYCYVVM